MEKVTGRSDDMMIVRGVNVFPTQIEEKLLTTPGLSPHYQIILTRKGRMDKMEIIVQARPELTGDDERKAAAEHLENVVKDTIGITAQIKVRDPGTIERSAGKVRRVFDNRERM